MVALALQFYVVSVVAANSQRATDILRERGGNVNWNVNFPDSVRSMPYFALMAGVWLAAVGIRIGVSRERLATALEAHRAPAEPLVRDGAIETRFREGTS